MVAYPILLSQPKRVAEVRDLAGRVCPTRPGYIPIDDTILPPIGTQVPYLSEQVRMTKWGRFPMRRLVRVGILSPRFSARCEPYR